IDDFVVDGTQNVDIVASAEGHLSSTAVVVVADDDNVIRYDLRGDDNVPRPQGQVVIQGNRVSNVSGVGILVGAVPRVAGQPVQPHPGVARNLTVLNPAPQLAPGVTIENNVVSFS